MRTLSLILVLFTSIYSWARPNLPEPEALLQKASKGRIELREVVLDIGQQISEMRDPRTFDKYFNILPELETLSLRHNLDEIYPEAVKTLGLKMVGQGIRWLSITKDSTERIAYYHRWVDGDVAANFFAHSDLEVREEEREPQLRKAAENLDYLVLWVDKALPERFDLRTAYRALQSKIAIKFLQKDLNDTDANYWVAKLSDPGVMSEYLDLIQADVFNIGAENKDTSHAINRRLRTLSDRVKQVFPNPPTWIVNYIADIQVEVIIRMLKFEEPMQAGEFPAALELLKSRQLQNLALQWMNPERVPSSGFASQYMDLSKYLALQLDAAGLKSESQELAKHVSRVAAPIYIADMKAEGRYELVDKKGNKWYFTIAEVRQGLLFAALVDENLFVHKAFFYIGYNMMDGRFVGSAREPDLDSTDAPVVEFDIKADGSIRIRDPYALEQSQELGGKKIESFDQYSSLTSTAPLNSAGVYEGEVLLPGGHKQLIRLTITSVNSLSVGRLAGPNGKMLDFNYGTSVNRPYIYLTTGRLPETTWVQIRGYFVNGEFRGKYIIGGRGISSEEFTLVKVK